MLMRLSYNLENARHRDGSKPADPSATAQPADDVAADDATSGRPTKVTKPKPTKSRSNKSAGGGGSGGSAASADPSKPAISPVLEFDDTDGDTLVVAPETAISYLDKLEEEMQAFDVPSILSCGNAVTTTRFDHLSGVQERGTIPQYAEKDVYSSIFPMNSAANLEILRTSNLFDLLKNNAELNNRLEAKVPPSPLTTTTTATTHTSLSPPLPPSIAPAARPARRAPPLLFTAVSGLASRDCPSSHGQSRGSAYGRHHAGSCRSPAGIVFRRWR